VVGLCYVVHWGGPQHVSSFRGLDNFRGVDSDSLTVISTKQQPSTPHSHVTPLTHHPPHNAAWYPQPQPQAQPTSSGHQTPAFPPPPERNGYCRPLLPMRDTMRARPSRCRGSPAAARRRCAARTAGTGRAAAACGPAPWLGASRGACILRRAWPLPSCTLRFWSGRGSPGRFGIAPGWLRSRASGLGLQGDSDLGWRKGRQLLRQYILKQLLQQQQSTWIRTTRSPKEHPVFAATAPTCRSSSPCPLSRASCSTPTMMEARATSIAGPARSSAASSRVACCAAARTAGGGRERDGIFVVCVERPRDGGWSGAWGGAAPGVLSCLVVD